MSERLIGPLHRGNRVGYLCDDSEEGAKVLARALIAEIHKHDAANRQSEQTSPHESDAPDETPAS